MIDLSCMRCGGELEEKPYSNGVLAGLELTCIGCGRRFIEVAPGIPTGNKYNVNIGNCSGLAIGNGATVVMNFE